MFSLLLDTCTDFGFVAIAKDHEMLRRIDFPFGFNNSKFLLPALEEIKNQINFDELSFIAVGNGPGSYTGIRVGVMAAKTLSYSTGVPLIGICSLEEYVPKHFGKYAAMIDAKIGGAYLLLGNYDANGISYLSQPKLCSIEELSKSLVGSTTIVSPDYENIKSKLVEINPGLDVNWEKAKPSAEQMLAVAIKKFAAKQYTADGSLEINYLRKTQAEIERETSPKGQRKCEH